MDDCCHRFAEGDDNAPLSRPTNNGTAVMADGPRVVEKLENRGALGRVPDELGLELGVILFAVVLAEGLPMTAALVSFFCEHIGQ